MKVVTLASSSKGNCVYLETSEKKILVDAGIGVSNLKKRLFEVGVDLSDIDTIILTHEHSDHIRGLTSILKVISPEIYAHTSTWKHIKSMIKKNGVSKLKKINGFEFEYGSFFIKGLKVLAFELSHDSDSCAGLVFEENDKKISIISDLGVLDSNIVNNIAGSDILLVESNYDESLLFENDRYPPFLKNRILSVKGHLSNNDCARLVYKASFIGVVQVILIHLSHDNNEPALAYNTVKNYLTQRGVVEGENIFVDVASRDRVGNIYNLFQK